MIMNFFVFIGVEKHIYNFGRGGTLHFSSMSSGALLFVTLLDITKIRVSPSAATLGDTLILVRTLTIGPYLPTYQPQFNMVPTVVGTEGGSRRRYLIGWGEGGEEE